PTDGVTGDVCPAGSYCPPGCPSPVPCPPGTYSNLSGLRSLQECLDCPPGCTVCPSGHFCGSTGLTAPSGPCSPGYYCLPGASSPSPPGVGEKGGPCPVSHFCPAGSSFPSPCRAGTYNNLTRQAACFPCAAGYYC
ncbi:AB24G protein, partial [Campylorhamphus procurvoides]|nr:AB24G protein [Campylorhamphus procurvoides]